MHRFTRRFTEALALLGLVSACTGPDATPTGPGAAASAPATSATQSPPASASAGASEGAAPEASIFADGVVSTDAEEYRISFTPDGQTAYFARGTGFFPQSRQATIYETTLVDGTWGEPTVASFSGTYPDIDPWVSPDGESIIFSSIRPAGGAERTDAELFRVDRIDGGWGEPVHLAALGSDADELGASVSEDGSVVFASNRTGGAGGWDLYIATSAGDAFDEPRPAEGINSTVWEFNPAIDPEGTSLVFTSISRPGGSGLGDLFVSTADGETWSEAVPLTLNTGADEYHPSRSPDGETLYFVRRTTHGDVYEVPWEAVAPEAP